MLPKRPVSSYGARYRRKYFIQRALFLAFAVTVLVLLTVFLVRARRDDVDERVDLRLSYESGAFGAAFARSGELLAEAPLDHLLLTVRGFSAYELAQAQGNTQESLPYLDASVWALRKALLFGKVPQQGRVFYVLGKAYFNKGHSYADMAVEYLEKARSVSYTAGDIPEYLGMAYASLGDFRASVEAFTLALAGGNPSDIMLLSIARSYMALEEYDSARAYLVRCAEVSRDSRTIAASRVLMGDILFKAGDISGAEAEYLGALEENGESAEARFLLGEVYAAGGDAVRARAEWRRAVRLDPGHEGARARLGTR